MSGLTCHVLDWIFCDVVNSSVRACTWAGRWHWLARDLNRQNESSIVSSSAAERKTAVALESQPAENLSARMHWDMPTKVVRENSAPLKVSCKSCPYELLWDLKQHESFMVWYQHGRGTVANTPARRYKEIILLKSDYLPPGSSRMLLLFWSQLANW